MRIKKISVCLAIFLLLVSSSSVILGADSANLPAGVESTGILRLATIGDPHYGWRDADRFYAHDIINAWMFDDKFPDIDFALNLGDFVSGDFYDTEEEIEAMWEHAMTDSFSRLLFPWMFAMGNHDVEENMPNIDTETRVAIAQRETGVMERCYAFMWDNILFLVQGWKGRGLSEEQKVWFTCMAETYPDTTTVIVRHAGPNEWFEEFFVENPQVVLFIYGHGHEFRQRTVEGVTVIEYGHTNNSVSWVGRPWTGYLEITESGITGGLYDVLEQDWVENRDFHVDVATTIKPTGLEWYSWSRFVGDDSSFEVDNRILAEEYYLELIGANLNGADGASSDILVSLNEMSPIRAERLGQFDVKRFPLDPSAIENDLRFNIGIDAGGTGFVRMVYVNPILLSHAASLGFVGLTDSGYSFEVEQVARYVSDNLVTLYPLRPGVNVRGLEAIPVRNGHYSVHQVPGENLPASYELELRPVTPPDVRITDFEVPDSVQQFDKFVVKATLENHGGPVKVRVGISVDSNPHEFKYVVLQSGESRELCYELEFASAGEYQIAIIGLDPKTVSVKAGLPF